MTSSELQAVVREPDQRGAEDDEEDRLSPSARGREEEERHDGRRENQETSHRRRALLHDVCRRPFRADLLPDIAHAQHFDELARSRRRRPSRSAPRSGQGPCSLGEMPRCLRADRARRLHEDGVAGRDPGAREIEGVGRVAAQAAGRYARAASETPMTSTPRPAASAPTSRLRRRRRFAELGHSPGSRSCASRRRALRDARAPRASSPGSRCRRRSRRSHHRGVLISSPRHGERRIPPTPSRARSSGSPSAA